jgi:hypothetical protein
MGSSESSAQAHSLRSAQNAVGTVINAARAHLVELQSAGVGYRQAAKLAGVSIQTVQDIRSGRVRKFKTETIEAVLGVRVKLAPGALVNAYATRRLIRALKLEGFSEAEIARRVGLRRGRIEWEGKSITVRNAQKIEALWREVSEGS